MSEPTPPRRRSNLRLALWFLLLAGTFYVGFFFAVANR